MTTEQGQPGEGHERHSDRSLCVQMECDGDQLGVVKAEHVSQELADDLVILLDRHGFTVTPEVLVDALKRRPPMVIVGVDPAMSGSLDASTIMTLPEGYQSARVKGRW